MIATQAVPLCTRCGSKVSILHLELHDHLFNVPGIWRVRKLPNPDCRLAWLKQMSTEADKKGREWMRLRWIRYAQNILIMLIATRWSIS